MNKLNFKLGIFTLVMCTTLCGWATNPCMPIAEACKHEGFYKGGNMVGKGLIENCVMPVVAHKKTLPNTTFSDTTLQQCGVEITGKMKARQQ